ncbi:PBP1A family penicillin-binding protein [Vagococcus sp. PNs007]|uniref:PBP1A family penicillin-binding protein n=1 Tax=Vagococcus proximus TaxID=2991417 RepID=A0ABT5WYQ0_9ENTE|nr:PBP1A family penicillin-binding protein [Vagococcus proximus]MDF0478885.1 PBP1A family penicillin-binding protein [Vagococcus proximus]
MPKDTSSDPLEQAIRAEKSRKSKRKRKWIVRFFMWLLAILCILFIAGAGFLYTIIKDSPKFEESKLADSLSSRIFDRKGKIIYEVGEEKRELAEIDEVPKQLKQAITSIEDKRFEKHIGIDPIRIMGAAISNLKGNNRQGGSTLTQQLIKLSFFSTDIKDQTYRRKIQEAWMSIQLEREKSKDEVINYYINKVYMSNRFYGMETAAKGYYGKELKDLNLAQTALLAGIPQAPTDYDPILHPEAAKKRRDLVLAEMHKDKAISKNDYEKAIEEPINKGLIVNQEISKDAKIIDNYIKEVIDEVKDNSKLNIYTDGLDIHTNLDLDAQKYLYQVVNSDKYIDYPDKDFQTAITIMNPNNGQVLAQIGGRHVPDNIQLGENFAVTAERDFGSTVKPITDYAPAIEYFGYSSAKYILDAPYTFPGTNDKVMNYDNRYRGNITMREALVDSRNVPAVKTLEEVGLEDAGDFLRGLGIDYGDDFYLSNAITGDPSSLQMAGAYSAFANGGTYYKPYYVNKITLPDGREASFKPKGVRAMKESTAYIITDMLKDVLRRGTGNEANIPGLPHAGKTGTSNYAEDFLDQVTGDAYYGAPDISFVGYTRNYTISVWTGYHKYSHAISKQDQNIAMLIYKTLMTYLSKDIETPDWEIPENVSKVGQELYVLNHVNEKAKKKKKNTANMKQEPIWSDNSDTKDTSSKNDWNANDTNQNSNNWNNNSGQNNVTEAPTTGGGQQTAPPTTEPPATEPPTTQPPTTQPPTTQPPATEPPATQPPATEPPATEPPATEPPATEPPATEPPATEPPATEPPATEPPAAAGGDDK